MLYVPVMLHRLQTKKSQYTQNQTLALKVRSERGKKRKEVAVIHCCGSGGAHVGCFCGDDLDLCEIDGQ